MVDVSSSSRVMKLSWLGMFTHAHFCMVLGFMSNKVGQADLQVLVCNQVSLVGLCMQYYKCLCAAVTICATLVNIQIHTETAL